METGIKGDVHTSADLSIENLTKVSSSPNEETESVTSEDLLRSLEFSPSSSKNDAETSSIASFQSSLDCPRSVCSTQELRQLTSPRGCSCCRSGLGGLSGPPKKRILMAVGRLGDDQGEGKAEVGRFGSHSPVTRNRRKSARKLFGSDEQEVAAGRGNNDWQVVRVPIADGSSAEFEFKCEQQVDSLSLWGFARFNTSVFPFIFRNGYKMVPVAVVVRVLFRPCSCSVPKTVLYKRQGLRRTSASWEEIRCVETVPICKETKITFGAALVQVDCLVAAFEEIKEEVTSRHRLKKISRKTASCLWLQSQE